MKLLEIYKCLCDETRLRILNLLAQGPLCVCHFQSVLGLSQVAVSKHLAYLRKRAMVSAERRGQWMVYQLPEKRSKELHLQLQCLQDCVQSHPIFREDLKRLRKLGCGCEQIQKKDQNVKLTEFKKALSEHQTAEIRFVLPIGSKVPPHAHVTEVARIDKRFVDCGGTFRTESVCRLQTWFQNDTDHRLSAGKLLGILEKASSFLGKDDLEVDVEYEAPFISQFPIESVEANDGLLVINLGIKRTACLAEDKCLPPKRVTFEPIPSFKPSKCCG